MCLPAVGFGVLHLFVHILFSTWLFCSAFAAQCTIRPAVSRIVFPIAFYANVAWGALAVFASAACSSLSYVCLLSGATAYWQRTIAVAP